jgi:hypothetical protein
MHCLDCPAYQGAIMSDKSPHKVTTKKAGKTLKEKRSAKKVKKAGRTSNIPPTDHR